MYVLRRTKKYVIVLSVILFVSLYGCSYSPENEISQFDIVTGVVDPVILLVASTCAYHYKKKMWPIIEQDVGSNSVFEYFSIQESDTESITLSFKLRVFNFDWESSITRDTEATVISCDTELRGGSPGREKLFKLPISIDTANIEELVGEDNRESRVFMGHYISLVGFFDKLIEKSAVEKSRNEFQSALITLGGYVTYGSLCVLLAIGGASCI